MAFGGSQAGVVGDATSFDDEICQCIAKEIGAPATAFVLASGANSVSARFFSTVMELPMCGHGTVCLMTRLIEQGLLDWNDGERIVVQLSLPSGNAEVQIERRPDGRPMVMLDIRLPSFAIDAIDLERLAGLLGLSCDDYDPAKPVETARGDFVHLIVPIRDLAAMKRMEPDFPGLISFSRDHDVETVATFCTEVELPGNSLHVRDFCPAVGVWESSSAGTTNGALASYLIRHAIVQSNGDGQIVLTAEQGHEINRPSIIRSIARMRDGAIDRLQVGGVATKFIEGQLHLPDAEM